MSYKIAIASSDRIHLNVNFGAAAEFLIYEVSDGGECKLLEIRNVHKEEENDIPSCQGGANNGCQGGCAGDGLAGSACGLGQNGSAVSPRVELLGDCRCILCKKVGFYIQKQLEKKAIVTFDVEGEIVEALQKITQYFHRVDHHQSLRGIAN